VCYNAPVLEALLHDPDAHALYLFPTKALAQDQIRALRVMLEGAAGYGPAPADRGEWSDYGGGGGGGGGGSGGGGEVYIPDLGVYDGDTCESERRRVKAEVGAIPACNPFVSTRFPFANLLESVTASALETFERSFRHTVRLYQTV